MSGSIRLTRLHKLIIRQRVSEGETQLALSIEYGVHKKTIWSIVNAEESSLKDPPASSSKSEDTKADTIPPAIPKPLVEGYYNPYVRYGNLTVTKEGSYIQCDADGKMVRVLSCPVYNKRLRCIGRYDVDVLTMNTKKEGKGRIAQWSGEKVEGRIVFTLSGNTATRIEFHPYNMPQKYMERDAKLRDRARKTG